MDMKEMKDEDLQHKIEQGDALDTSVEVEAYRKVFSSLQREPDFTLHSSFEDLVIQRIAAKHAMESSRDGWWFLGGILLFIIGLVVAIVLIDFKPDVGVYSFLKGYPGLVIFAFVFILILNFIDRKFIRNVSHL
jgi:hypothetical protein